MTGLRWIGVGGVIVSATAAGAQTLEEGVRELFGRKEIPAGQTLRVAAGEFKFEGMVPSAFGEYLASELGVLIGKWPGLEEVSRRDLARILEEQKMALSGLVEDATAAKVGKLKGVQVILMGDFWDGEREVKVNLATVHVETGARRTATVLVPKAQLPSGMALRPDNYQAALDAVKMWGEEAGKSKELKVRLWVDSPTNTYKQGESMIVRFASNRDCYVKLIHMDQRGVMHQLFPNAFVAENFIKANVTYNLPNEEMGFTIDVSPPYGIETLKLLASLQPFKEDPAGAPREGEPPFKELGKADKKTVGLASRDFKIVPVQKRAEATLMVTTMEK